MSKEKKKTKKEKIEAYDKILKQLVNDKEFVKIARTVTEGDADIQGFILDMSTDFILIQRVEEFLFNGYAITRQDHFDAISSDESEKTIKEILTAEGTFEKSYGMKADISMDSWKAIFTDLHKGDHYVSIECEDLKNPEFYIGPIVNVKEKSVEIRYFDAMGVLDAESTKVKYKDITLVGFGDRYVETFRKYLKEEDKSEMKS